MRSVFDLAGGMPGEGDATIGGRQETLRKKALARISLFFVAVSALALPFALVGLMHGEVVGFAATMIALAGSMVALGFGMHRRHDDVPAVQAGTMLLIGALLGAADPALADFGLATALLAPIHATMLGRSALARAVWIALACVVGLLMLGTSGLLPRLQGGEVFVAAGVYFTAALAIAYAAHRLNATVEAYEKAQANAYRHLVEHVPDAVLRFGSDGTVLFVSRSAETLLGCRRYELTADGLIDRTHVLDRPAYLTALADSSRTGTTRKVEMRMRRDDPNGRAPHFLWIETAITPVLDDTRPGVRHELVVLLRDVTERKDFEVAMRKAREAAEDASSAKSRFLASIGHELRTPLNAIIGFSEMMGSGIGGDLAPAHKDYAAHIRESGEHLLEVVNMLLDMSRIEAGKFELNPDSFAPEGLIAPCLQMVEGLARGRKVELKTLVPRTLPSIMADERACRQILINLLSNAIKFSREGGAVTLTMKRQGPNLVIAVADTGIGMRADSVARIGEPFFQAEDGLARGFEGTGLGLSIVKGLVELHGGSLHVRSEPGQGTTMTVLLPVNGPETIIVETAGKTRLDSEPKPATLSQWQDKKRSVG